MRSVQVTRLDGPQAVELVHTDDAVAGVGQVLVEVHTAGVAFPDVLLTRGAYQLKPPPPFILGAEVSGLVRSAPEGSGFAAGDRVVAFPGLGGFAELVAVDPSLVFRLPEATSLAAGAALPMNYLTVEFALERRGALREGETVLVHGAAGGIGTATVQLAKLMGATVFAVVSTEDKIATARGAGADEVLLAAGFKDKVVELTDGRGVDMVVDPVGGDRFTDSLRSLAPEGRLLVIGFTGGEIPTVKVNRLLLNNITVMGVGWGAYWTRRPAFLQEQWSRLLPHLASGRIEPPISSTHPLEAAAVAIGELDQRRATGKVLLSVR